jgi:hypothetical protein
MQHWYGLVIIWDRDDRGSYVHVCARIHKHSNNVHVSTNTPTYIRKIRHRRTRESIDNKANGFAAAEQSQYSESAEKPEDYDGHRAVRREKWRDKSHHHNCQEA